MTDRQTLRETLTDQPAVADAEVLHMAALNRFEGIIDVYLDEIRNPRTYIDELNELVTITDHGQPVAQEKLSASLSPTSNGEYDRTVHRYEFIKPEETTNE